MAAQASVTRIPNESAPQSAAGELRFNDTTNHPLHRLPFVGVEPGKRGASFWAVPRTGGYGGGNQTGKALARIYMKHLKEHGSGLGGGSLQLMVLDMFDCEHGDNAEQDALRGQVVGFFAELERWLSAAAKHLDGGLDQDDNQALLKAANAGLGSGDGVMPDACGGA